jgi:hypothetical protein
LRYDIIWLCFFRQAREGSTKILLGDETESEINLISSLAGTLKCHSNISKRQ